MVCRIVFPAPAMTFIRYAGLQFQPIPELPLFDAHLIVSQEAARTVVFLF